jgi:hypothetical protein
MHRLCSTSNTTHDTCEAGTSYSSEAPDFALAYCVVFCRLVFVLLVFFLPLYILSVLRFTTSDYPFAIFKLFLQFCLSCISIAFSSPESQAHMLFFSLLVWLFIVH